MSAISYQEGLRKLSFTIRDWLNKNAIINKSILPAGTNLNTVKQPGYYFLVDGFDYYQIPATAIGSGDAFLWIISDSQNELDECVQFYLQKDKLKLYTRQGAGDDFSDWQSIITTEIAYEGITDDKIESWAKNIYDTVANTYVDKTDFEDEIERVEQSLEDLFQEAANAINAWGEVSATNKKNIEKNTKQIQTNTNDIKSTNEYIDTQVDILKTLIEDIGINGGIEPGTGIPQITINKDIDLNSEELQKTGIYFLSSGFNYPNRPEGTKDGGLLLVYADNTLLSYRIYQFFVSASNIVYARKTTGYYQEDNVTIYGFVWSNWIAINKISDLEIMNIKAKLDPIAKSEILIPGYGNIFDGTYVKNYRIGGPAQQDIENENDRYNLSTSIDYNGIAIIPIEPNTVYWTGVNRVVLEQRPAHETTDTNYYQYFAIATATKILGLSESFDGQVFRKNPKERNIIGHIFTTGPNDKYLYVQTSRNPNELPYLEVIRFDSVQDATNAIAATDWGIDFGIYNGPNDKENNTGVMVVFPPDVENKSIDVMLTSSYNSVKYKFNEEKIDLGAHTLIKELQDGQQRVENTLNAEITNSLIVKRTLPAGIKNLFDGCFIDSSAGYRIGGTSIASLIKSSPSASIALMSITPGKTYHLYVSPYGKETTDNKNYFDYLKIGVSDVPKDELKTKIEKGQTPISLGHIYQSDIHSDFIFTVDNEYYPRESGVNKTEQPIVANTLVLQVSVEHNLPFIMLQEMPDDDSYYKETTRYSSVVQAAASDASLKIYYDKNLLNYYVHNPGATNGTTKEVQNTYGDIEIIYGRNKYLLKHQWNRNQGVGTWRWYQHNIDDGVLFSNGDCEGPIKVLKVLSDNSYETPKDYIGGFHGNEGLNHIKCYLDGQLLDLTQEKNYYNVKEFKTFISSKCYWSQSERLYLKSGYKCSIGNRAIITITDSANTKIGEFKLGTLITDNNIQNISDCFENLNNFIDLNKAIIDIGKTSNKYFLVLNYRKNDYLFDRNKQITITPNNINIKNYWNYKNANGQYALLQSLHTGLYSIMFKYLNGVSSNYKNNVYRIPENNEDRGLILDDHNYTKEITFLGKSFTSTIKSLNGHGKYYKGRIKDMDTAGSSDFRYKAYLSDGPWELNGNNDKVILLGNPETNSNYINEFMGEFEITTTAPSGYFLNENGTVEELN